MFKYMDIPFSQVSVIKDLWERNRKYHEELSEFFGELYLNMVFEERINSFNKFDENHIKITLAKTSNDESLIGYCISTFNGIEGSTQTLHVHENFRGTGVGRNLMNSHIGWLKGNGCEVITITVSYENNNTIMFYESLGFKPNTIEMRLSDTKK